MAVAVLVHPFVVDPGSLDRNRSGSQEDLALFCVAVAYDQGVALPVALTTGLLEVVSHLGLQSLGEHPPRPLTSNLVEVEQALFAALCVLV